MSRATAPSGSPPSAPPPPPSSPLMRTVLLPLALALLHLGCHDVAPAGAAAGPAVRIAAPPAVIPTSEGPVSLAGLAGVMAHSAEVGSADENFIGNPKKNCFHPICFPLV